MTGLVLLHHVFLLGLLFLLAVLVVFLIIWVCCCRCGGYDRNPEPGDAAWRRRRARGCSQCECSACSMTVPEHSVNRENCVRYCSNCQRVSAALVRHSVQHEEEDCSQCEAAVQHEEEVCSQCEAAVDESTSTVNAGLILGVQNEAFQEGTFAKQVIRNSTKEVLSKSDDNAASTTCLQSRTCTHRAVPNHKPCCKNNREENNNLMVNINSVHKCRSKNLAVCRSNNSTQTKAMNEDGARSDSDAVHSAKIQNDAENQCDAHSLVLTRHQQSRGAIYGCVEELHHVTLKATCYCVQKLPSETPRSCSVGSLHKVTPGNEATSPSAYSTAILHRSETYSRDQQFIKIYCSRSDSKTVQELSGEITDFLHSRHRVEVLSEEDIMLGHPLIAGASTLIQQSDMCIFVVDADFLKEPYKMFELRTSINNFYLFNKNCKVILVLNRSVSGTNLAEMDDTVKDFMEKHRYLKEGDENFYAKLSAVVDDIKSCSQDR